MITGLVHCLEKHFFLIYQHIYGRRGGGGGGEGEGERRGRGGGGKYGTVRILQKLGFECVVRDCACANRSHELYMYVGVLSFNYRRQSYSNHF